MSLSLTCTCGAKLEIDDKFAGRIIHCPDCHKEIAIPAQPMRALRTSWFAMLSVVLAIIGALSVVGTLAGAGCGWLALRHIRLYPDKVGGKKFAWAGIYLGSVFSLLGLACYFSPEVLGLDGFFRQIEWARKLNYGGKLTLTRETSHPASPSKFSITRSNGSWGAVVVTKVAAESDKADDLILIQPWLDAQIACLTIEQPPEDADELMEEAKSQFLASQLLQLLSRLPGKKAEIKASEPFNKDPEKGEMVIDIKVGGYERRFIVRVKKVEGEYNRIVAIVAGTRRSRFQRLEPELRKIISDDSFQIEQ